MKTPNVILALLLCGCANSNDLEQFRVADNNAKLFFFATYDSFVDKPWFGDNFRLYIDGKYIGDITDSQYLAAHIPPGNHEFDVEEFGWLGTLLHRSTANGHIPPGEASFLAAHTISTYQFEVATVDVNVGVKDVLSRSTVGPDTDYSTLQRNQPHADVGQEQRQDTKGMLDIDPSQVPPANAPDLGNALATGLAAYGQARANSDAARIQSLQNTPSMRNNTFIGPQDNRPHCSQYCQIMVDTGHVTANDPCAVQCK